MIERTFYIKEGKLYLACNDKKAFFTSKDHYKGYQHWSCQNVCDALSFLLDNIYIRFGTKLYRQIVGIPMGTNCAPLIADLIERTFYIKEGKLYLACNDKKAFFTSKDHYKGYQHWSCQNVCDALSFLLDNIYIRFGTKLNRQIVGIPMGTNCAPLIADLFLFCYERDSMKDLSSDNQAEVIKAFNSTSRYLGDLLNIDNPYFEGMVNQIYPSELQLNKANTSDTEAPFLDLYLSISNGFVSSKIYDKRGDFDFDIVNF